MFRFCTCLLLILSAVQARASSDKNLVYIHYHTRPPYYVTQDKHVSGLVVDPAIASLKKAQLPYLLIETAPKRQLQYVKDNVGYHCALGWFKTDEREKQGQFSHALFRDKKPLLMIRKDDKRFDEIQSKTALWQSGLVMLIKDGYSYGNTLDPMIHAKQIKTESTTGDNLTMMRMLVHGRADYFLLSSEEMLTLNQTDIPEAAMVKIHTIADFDLGITRHLYCSKSVPASWMYKLNAAIDQVVPELNVLQEIK